MNYPLASDKGFHAFITDTAKVNLVLADLCVLVLGQAVRNETPLDELMEILGGGAEPETLQLLAVAADAMKGVRP